jgi:hypothetical protein
VSRAGFDPGVAGAVPGPAPTGAGGAGGAGGATTGDLARDLAAEEELLNGLGVDRPVAETPQRRSRWPSTSAGRV